MGPDKTGFETNLELVEIGYVPYIGLPECKECPEKSTTVIEHRMYDVTGCVGVDTHLECVKLDLCKNVKRHLVATMYADE